MCVFWNKEMGGRIIVALPCNIFEVNSSSRGTDWLMVHVTALRQESAVALGVNKKLLLHKLAWLAASHTYLYIVGYRMKYLHRKRKKNLHIQF